MPALMARLQSISNILITTHTNPDGDAIGSSLALAAWLSKRGHQVHVMIPDPFPEFLSWMNGQDSIVIFRDHPDLCTTLINEASIIIAADYNDFDRLNDAAPLVRGSSALKVLIDHHLNPANDFNLQVSKTAISSTSELVYAIMEYAGDLALLDREMAECLYAGIITDTGSLSYACNYVKTYQVIADLVRTGIDGEYIHRLIYDTYSESRLRLLGFSISERLVVLPEYHTAYITLSKEDLLRFNYKIGDTEGIVNYALSIANINLAALFMERDGIVKVSFRSKGKFSVNKLASGHFNGGGHRNAAGANSDLALLETVNKFRDILPDYQSGLSDVYAD